MRIPREDGPNASSSVANGIEAKIIIKLRCPIAVEDQES